MNNSPPDPLSVVRHFIDRVNHHDVRGICSLMTDDHLFVDPLGNAVRGREEMRKAWIGYFFFFPDYALKSTIVMEQNGVVALFGKASGTYTVEGKTHTEASWEIPAAAMAVVREGLVAEWHVFADNEPVRQIMARQDLGSNPR